jgi:pilus assembly protein CpaC
MAMNLTPPATERTIMNFHKFLSRRGQMMKSSFMAASLLSISLVLGVNFATIPQGVAADSDAAAAESNDQGRFVRMGLNKSVVVRLPAEAKDVIVGNPEIVDAVVRTKTTAYLFARKTGQTNIFFFDAAGQQILALDLEVAMDVTGARKLLDRSLPGNRITIDTINNNIVLGGIAHNGLEAKTAVDLASEYAKADGGTGQIVNTMSIAGEDQVMLKVKVVEIQRDVLKQFGVDLSALLDVGKFAFKLASVSPFANGLISENSGYKTAYASGGTKVEGLIRAMEGDGLVRTLAEPNLTALTGQSAKFHAGGELPYRLCTNDSTGTNCTVAFKDYGVQVEFTPTVLSEQRINLKIKTDVSELSSISSGGIPAINRRLSETVLELPSGGSMMIAGLIKESTRQNINGTPGLKQLPVLGSLFRSRDFVANETELVVIVTPVLVRPTDQGKLTTPDKGFAPPSDAKAILFGRLNKVYGSGGDAPQGAYQGNVGFIVE